MARNQYGGTCYKCGRFVEPGTGHFELHKDRWRTQHGLYPGEGRITCDEAEAAAIPPEQRERNKMLLKI